MAEAKTESAAPKKKSKLLLFIIIGVLVLALGAVGAVLLLKKPPVDDGEDGDSPTHKTEKKKAEPGLPPAYLKLDTFTSNLAAENPGEAQTAQFIQVVVELKVENAHEADVLKPYTPEIRNAVLRLLTSRKASQLISVEGKDALAHDIQQAVNMIVNPPRKGSQPPDEPVQAVLFSSFIIQ